jgi:hypothetical protein
MDAAHSALAVAAVRVAVGQGWLNAGASLTVRLIVKRLMGIGVAEFVRQSESVLVVQEAALEARGWASFLARLRGVGAIEIRGGGVGRKLGEGATCFDPRWGGGFRMLCL